MPSCVNSLKNSLDNEDGVVVVVADKIDDNIQIALVVVVAVVGKLVVTQHWINFYDL